MSSFDSLTFTSRRNFPSKPSPPVERAELRTRGAINSTANAWQDREDDLQQPQDDYVWDDEAIAWEEGFHPDNLYPQ